MTDRFNLPRKPVGSPSSASQSGMSSAINSRGGTSSPTYDYMSTPCPNPRQQAGEQTPNSSPPDMVLPMNNLAREKRRQQKAQTSSPSSPATPGFLHRDFSSHTVDRVTSVLGFHSIKDIGSDERTDKFNDSYWKTYTAMTSHLAEIEVRLGMRTLPASQAAIRLEKFRLDRDEGEISDPFQLALLVAQELHDGVTRLEEICKRMQECDNSPPVCLCNYLHGANSIAPFFSLRDHLSGRTIQSYLDQCRSVTRDESSAIRAVYDGLAPVFRKGMGEYAPEKARCQSFKGFLAAWRTLFSQPSFLNSYDKEVSRLQEEGIRGQERGQHVGKQSFGKKITNLLRSSSRRGSAQSNGSSTY